MAPNLRLLFDRIDAQLSTKPYIGLQHLSRQLRVDRHAIEAAVRHTQGVCFRTYQKQQVLHLALLLLTQSVEEMTVKEIAISLGYRSAAGFTRFIKSATGQTPTRIKLGTFGMYRHELQEGMPQA